MEPWTDGFGLCKTATTARTFLPVESTCHRPAWTNGVLSGAAAIIATDQSSRRPPTLVHGVLTTRRARPLHCPQSRRHTGQPHKGRLVILAPSASPAIGPGHLSSIDDRGSGRAAPTRGHGFCSVPKYFAKSIL